MATTEGRADCCEFSTTGPNKLPGKKRPEAVRITMPPNDFKARAMRIVYKALILGGLGFVAFESGKAVDSNQTKAGQALDQSTGDHADNISAPDEHTENK